MTDEFPELGDDLLFRVLSSVGIALRVSIDRSDIVAAPTTPSEDPLSRLVQSAAHAGVFCHEEEFTAAREMIGFIREGYPVVIAKADGEFVVLGSVSGRRIEASVLGDRTRNASMTARQLTKMLRGDFHRRIFVFKKELLCDSISAAPGHHELDQGHYHEHPTPLRRFLGLLSLDRRDIFTVFLFAFVAGILTLAIPLAVEALVNVVSWGTYLQPLLVLGMMLLTCLGLAGVLSVLQTVVVEFVQRRQFVRIISDLAHRFPRANQESLIGEYPRELANRVFDVMTIQKATATLLMDGVMIILTTAIGLVLLAFYHPFLLGFDIVLLICMISLTWLLGSGGVRTAIDESITKYEVVHWLQDVIASPSVFKTGGGRSLAVHRANQLTADYIHAREKQFRVVLRQVIFAVGLQVVASTTVLVLGGWLVIDGQLTLGQLVASELVVTVVVGAFAKAGKSLEKFYDLMAGIDKVGHLIDIPVDPRHELGMPHAGPAEVSWSQLSFHSLTSNSQVPPATIAPGSRVAIVGDDVEGRSMFVQTLAGLIAPSSGIVQVMGFDPLHVAANSAGQYIGYAGRNEIFHGTLRENIDLGRSGFGQNRVREVLDLLGMKEVMLKLPDGLNSQLQTKGYPLTEIQVKKLVLARAVLASPKLLIVDGILDEFSNVDRQKIWQAIAGREKPWTLIVNTNRDDVASLCDSQIAIRTLT